MSDPLARAHAAIRRAAEAGERDHRRAPLLEALEAYHATGVDQFCIPAHKQGSAVDAGLEEGMYIESAVDPSLEEIRVVT